MKLTIQLLFASALLCAPLRADEVVLKDHHILHGTVISSTPEAVVFDHEAGALSEQLTLPVDRIEPYSFYVIRKAAAGDDAQAHMQLGQFCLANGLHTRAREEFYQAQNLDPTLAEKAQEHTQTSREETAKELLAQADAFGDKHETFHERDALRQIVNNFPDTSYADAARQQLTDGIHLVLGQRAAARAKEEHEQGEHELARVHRIEDRAAAYMTQGLNQKELGQSLKDYQRAITEYQRATHELIKLQHTYKGDAGLTETLVAELQQVQGDLIDTHLDVGSVYLTRTSYQQALAQANQCLAIDPQSAQAQAFKTRVANASSHNGVVWL
jgi:hypothetical protein